MSSGQSATSAPPPGLLSRPEYPLLGRHLSAYRWLPKHAERLLDAGCAWGYATRCFATRATQVSGIDPDGDAIAVAQYRYPEIDFVQGVLERLPYDDASFDVVTCCDTLEHVADERRSLDEMWRVLRPGGTLIISTPHRGLFAWLDHSNYLPALRETVARCLPRFFTAVQAIRRKPVLPIAAYAWERHRHYTLRDYHKLFQSTAMEGTYRVDRVRRSGLLIFPLGLNITFYASALPPTIRDRILRPVQWLSEREYWMPCGPLAYNVGVRIVKEADPAALGANRSQDVAPFHASRPTDPFGGSGVPHVG